MNLGGDKEDATCRKSLVDQARTGLDRIVVEMPEFEGCEPFSPDAYNRISSLILAGLYDCIEEISELSSEIGFNYNLALIFFKNFQVSVCQHYFEEYERVLGFIDPTTETPVGRRIGLRSPRSLPGRIHRKIRAIRWARRRASQITDIPSVSYVGNTTFTWTDLGIELRKRGVDLIPDSPTDARIIRDVSEQKQCLSRWIERVHGELARWFDQAPENLRPFNRHALEKCINLPEMSVSSLASADLLVTGSLSDSRARLAATRARSNGIPVLMICHGAHHLIFDAPYYALTEGILADAKMAYGDIEKQRAVGTLGGAVDLMGRPVRFFSRTDPLVERFRANGPVLPVRSLRGSRVLYIATNCSAYRYGPFRDVHPATYMQWQMKLLTWLEEQTGKRPLVRLHPKRRTHRYDPPNFKMMDGDLGKVFEQADVYAIDYPTTTLAYVNATNKPVLFFDPGMRRLQSGALELIRGRCHYARVDMLHPEEGFERMKLDFGRRCEHTFNPVFSEAPTTEDEVVAVADAVCTLLDRSGSETI